MCSSGAFLSFGHADRQSHVQSLVERCSCLTGGGGRYIGATELSETKAWLTAEPVIEDDCG